MSELARNVDISKDVLFGIAQLALEQVEGLTPTTPPVRMGEILTGRRAKGIIIDRQDDQVTIDLKVSIVYGLQIPKIAKEAQRVVREAVTSMTGLVVESVTVTVEKIDLPDLESPRGKELTRGKA